MKEEKNKIEEENKKIKEEKENLNNMLIFYDNQKEEIEKEMKILNNEKKKFEEEKGKFEKEKETFKIKINEQLEKVKKKIEQLNNEKKNIFEEQKKIEKEKKNLYELKKTNEEIKQRLENEINLYIDRKKRKQYKRVLDDVLNNKNYNNKSNEEKISDICIIGNALKKEIEAEEKKPFCQYIDLNKELANGNNNPTLLPLMLIKSILNENGCKVAIERNANNINLNNLCIQKIVSHQALEKKITITFENKNELLLNDNKRNEFLNSLKDELWKIFHIDKKDVFFLDPRGPGFTIDLYISGIDEKTENRINNYIKRRKDIINIVNSVLMEGCKLSFDLFEPQFNMKPSDWPKEGGKRGGLGYFPPYKYYGCALRVKGTYDNGDDTWLGHVNIDGEFAVAYHGIRADNVLEVVNKVVHSHLKNGKNNAFANDEDAMHPGHKCGVYVTPLIEVAEIYTKEVKINQLKKKYRIVFQCRVNPKIMRQPVSKPEYWILDGNGQEIRPYRVLIKEC